MSAPELKPCPFCGASVSLEKAEVGRNPKEWWGVVCRGTKNLGGTCAIQQRASRTKEAAITRWNIRAEAPAAPKVNALKVSVDQLAQIIRQVDGENTLGAGELAERILAAWESGDADK